MSENDELKPSQFAGCATAMIRMMVTLPMWYVLLFGIIGRIDAPNWLWILFWVYMPVGVLLSIAEEFEKTMNRNGQ